MKWQQDIIKDRGYYTKSIVEIPNLEYTPSGDKKVIWEKGELYRHINKIGKIDNNKWYLFFDDTETNNEIAGISWDEYVSIFSLPTESVKIISQYADTDDKFCAECSQISIPIRAQKDCCRRRKCYYKNDDNKCIVKR